MSNNQSTEPDPYGNLGAVHDGLWTSKWSGWTREFLDNYFASIATWGPLNVNQCCLLLQGQPPTPPGGDEIISCLGEYENLVGRFRADVKRGALAANPTANELAAWCDHMNADLPRALVEAIIERAAGLSPSQSAPQSSSPIILAPWIPLNLNISKRVAIEKPTLGRPSTAKATYEAMVKAGKKELMAHARRGKDLKLLDIARILIGKGLTPGMTEATVISRLKSKLPVEKAKLTAAEAISRRP